MTAIVSVPWRSDAARLTRDEAAATLFPVTGWTKRGYDPAAVDAFTARVVAELEMLATEKTAAWAALADLRRRFINHEDPGDWPGGAAEALEMAVSVRSEAQLAADQAVAAAQDLAARVTSDARAQRDALLADAERVRRDADAYAERVRAEAEGQARKAASAALERPVGPDAERLVRAERARSASQGARSDVYVKHIRILLAAGMEICDQAQQEPGGA